MAHSDFAGLCNRHRVVRRAPTRSLSGRVTPPTARDPARTSAHNALALLCAHQTPTCGGPLLGNSLWFPRISPVALRAQRASSNFTAPLGGNIIADVPANSSQIAQPSLENTLDVA